MGEGALHVKLRYCYQGERVRYVNDFSDLRGAKRRPDDLTCPHCKERVTVKLSPTGQITDHFAHYPNSDCPLREAGESAYHLNAKGNLSRKMSAYHHFRLIHECFSCRQWQAYLSIDEYDDVQPELRAGQRRPDVSCLLGGETVGAAEVYYSHAVDEEKKLDLMKLAFPWFEIPHSSVRQSVFKTFYKADVLDIDGKLAGIMYPTMPMLCPPCAKVRAKDFLKPGQENKAVDGEINPKWAVGATHEKCGGILVHAPTQPPGKRDICNKCWGRGFALFYDKRDVWFYSLT